MFIIVGFFEIAALDFQVSSNDALNFWLSSPTIPDAVSAVNQLVSPRLSLQTYSIASHGCFSCEANWFPLGLVCMYPLDG